MIHKNPPYFTVISSDKLILSQNMQWKEQLTIFHVAHKCLCMTFDFFRYAKLFLALFIYINYFPVLCLLHNKRKGVSP